MRRPPMRHDLSRPEGPMLTPTELALSLGLPNGDFVREEIRSGQVRAVRPFRGRRKSEYRIPWKEAQAYARRLGVLPGGS